MTHRARYSFRVKEFADGKPWIAAERLGGEDLPGVKGLLGFDLKAGMTYDEAQEVARFMNDQIASISLTPL